MKTYGKVLAMAGMWVAATVAMAQAPNIASYDPWHGDPGDTINITGNNLGTTTALYFNNVASPSVTIQSNSSILAVVPPSATTGKLKVVTTLGEYTTGSDFVVGSGGGNGDSDGGGGGGYTPVVPPDIPIPAGAMVGHPRLYIRKTDLPKYKSWATPSNPVWNDMLVLAAYAKNLMDTNQINDVGMSNGNVNAPNESFAQLFALMSLVHPDPAARQDYAQRAHDLVMVVFDNADLGMEDGQPFRGHLFATENRANWYGEGLPLTVDWCYQTFSAAEKAKIRRVFLRWVQENCHASTTAMEHPRPLNTYNDPALVNEYDKVRWAGNNYYAHHARTVGMLAIALDEADDIPSDADQPPAGTLRKFVGHAIQAWLYQRMQYEKTVGAGGVSPEGLGYGELSNRAMAWLLLSLRTAGVDKPLVYGPQASLMKTTYWQREIPDSYVHMMSPSKQVVENWVGPTYMPFLFSDDAYYLNRDYVRVLAPLAIEAMMVGDSARYAKLRWMMDNMAPGGLNYRSTRITQCISGSSTSLATMYFLATDPNVTNPPDPRPAMPTEYFAKGMGLFSSRTSWQPDASWFIIKSSWTSIDHQYGDANGFGFWRGGEWLTKVHTGYGPRIACSDNQNTIAIQNPGTTDLDFWVKNMDNGSQWVYNQTQDPKGTMWSAGNGYAFYQSDTTASYNNTRIGANAVTHASRSAVFVKPDVLVLYDRATTNPGAGFKRFWLNTPTQTAVSGQGGLMTTDNSQRMYISTLLPAAATITSGPAQGLGGEPAQYDPMVFRYRVEAAGNPDDVRFLNVLQGANVGGAKLPTSSFVSSAGTPFDGTVVGNTAVAFKRGMYTAFSGVTFVVPASTTRILVTGLAQNGAYTVTVTNVAGGKQIKIAKGGATLADNAGVLAI